VLDTEVTLARVPLRGGLVLLINTFRANRRSSG